ncbi:hypothetical protein A2230_01430 [candidate division WOR-1 bacterium RIFOXYA2_FULL_36_21]|uniref:UPF0235 protein A2290_06900 n=1 Tax=candidate division WOR-1 bacterium RIFOXYB2_FULL_36_35 TaxID=1802578 RepID=A0A1F4S6A0_UNCSA|nr:MAG: hypothetical protein A2230_01430 [candidate division WOR-1 bacterium RIFOXYA2_FULL_36_21]OGC14363.1 MAG: hypothetical protein A2282_07925 [candidate division WOR-1 bacterium RIFOXYA12_FULL_36_13]OGC15961.1 MAG: hypothetical protein A2290_06900 [candidate division WOR-1 bacterium RIFOXYB2_FULL_36_35]
MSNDKKMREKVLKLKIIPNAKRNELKGDKVYLTAPPVDGKANKALIEFLSEHFKIKKRQISIVRGEKSRNKVVAISQHK